MPVYDDQLQQNTQDTEELLCEEHAASIDLLSLMKDPFIAH